jgi:cysteinyl-tRNA synthetase
MSMKLLGRTLDIHGGGLDLEFPHHENELAQSESYTGMPFVRYWMHHGLMRIHSQASKIKGDHPGEGGGPQKMSKSLGNEIVVTELVKRHQPETLRFFLLATHYRRPIDYSEERLVEVRKGLEGFYRLFERFERVTGESFYGLPFPNRRGEFDTAGLEANIVQQASRLRQQFLDHMDDDFNTGGAIGVLYEMLSALNRFADQHELDSKQTDRKDVAAFRRSVAALKEMSQILGIFLESPSARASAVVISSEATSANSGVPAASGSRGEFDDLRPALVQILNELDISAATTPPNDPARMVSLLVQRRVEARKAKNFSLGDLIRERLAKIGILLEDRKGETLVRRA